MWQAPSPSPPTAKPADEIDVNVRKIILHYTAIIRDLESQLSYKSTVISNMERQIASNKVAMYKAHVALQQVRYLYYTYRFIDFWNIVSTVIHTYTLT